MHMPAPQYQSRVGGRPRVTRRRPKESGLSAVALVLGVVALAAWIAPIIGVVVSVVGIWFASRVLRDGTSVSATAGMLFCTVGLIASLIYGAYSIHYGITEGDRLLRERNGATENGRSILDVEEIPVGGNNNSGITGDSLDNTPDTGTATESSSETGETDATPTESSSGGSLLDE